MSKHDSYESPSPTPGSPAAETVTPKPGVFLTRGVLRLLSDLDRPGLEEFTLSNSRRADVLALGRDGEFWLVEVKSSIADFRADDKWQDYLPWCDRFFFAVPAAFPQDLIPSDCGLMVVDQWGGAILRQPEPDKLAPARRKKLTLDFARTAARRRLPDVTG